MNIRRSLLTILILLLILTFGVNCGNGGNNDDRGDSDEGDDDDDMFDDDDDQAGDDDDDDTAPPENTWTILIYMAADNDLEEFAWWDLDEIKEVGSNQYVNILIVFDGTENEDSRYYYATAGNLQQEELPGELNMGAAQTIKDGAKWAFNTYPADRYGLIFWNHGSGWHKDAHVTKHAHKYICEDYGSGDDWLDNEELDEALGWIRANTVADKIDLLGFDACLMQMIEIAYYVKDDADYLVASQETEGGQGWAYDLFLDDVAADADITPQELGAEIVDTFVSYPDATLSVIRLDKVNQVATAVQTFAGLLAEIGGIDNSEVNDALYDTLYFDDWDYIDLSDFARQVKTADISTAINGAADEVMDTVDDAVYYKGYGYPEYSAARGVSIYFPDPQDFDADYLDLDFAIDTGWDAVIH